MEEIQTLQSNPETPALSEEIVIVAVLATHTQQRSDTLLLSYKMVSFSSYTSVRLTLFLASSKKNYEIGSCHIHYQHVSKLIIFLT